MFEMLESPVVLILHGLYTLVDGFAELTEELMEQVTSSRYTDGSSNARIESCIGTNLTGCVRGTTGQEKCDFMTKSRTLHYQA